jgi:hypothetical protein
VSGEGVEDVLRLLSRAVDEAKSADPNHVPAAPENAWRP